MTQKHSNYRVVLSKKDIDFAAKIGSQRYGKSRQKGTTDRANSDNPDRVGTLGEVAFGKLVGFPRLSKAGGGSDHGIDYPIQAADGSGKVINIDVKSVSRPTNRWLILTNQGPWRCGTVEDLHDDTDVWVMMRPETENLDSWIAVGWCNREDALSAELADIPGNSKPLGIHYMALRSMDTLLPMLKLGTGQEEEN